MKKMITFKIFNNPNRHFNSPITKNIIINLKKIIITSENFKKLNAIVCNSFCFLIKE